MIDVDTLETYQDDDVDSWTYQDDADDVLRAMMDACQDILDDEASGSDALVGMYL